jgi:hypothetical protein
MSLFRPSTWVKPSFRKYKGVLKEEMINDKGLIQRLRQLYELISLKAEILAAIDKYDPKKDKFIRVGHGKAAYKSLEEANKAVEALERKIMKLTKELFEEEKHDLVDEQLIREMVHRGSYKESSWNRNKIR